MSTQVTSEKKAQIETERERERDIGNTESEKYETPEAEKSKNTGEKESKWGQVCAQGSNK